jgi:hypothetical protein
VVRLRPVQRRPRQDPPRMVRGTADSGAPRRLSDPGARSPPRPTLAYLGTGGCLSDELFCKAPRRAPPARLCPLASVKVAPTSPLLEKRRVGDSPVPRYAGASGRGEGRGGVSPRFFFPALPLCPPVPRYARAARWRVLPLGCSHGDSVRASVCLAGCVLGRLLSSAGLLRNGGLPLGELLGGGQGQRVAGTDCLPRAHA